MVWHFRFAVAPSKDLSKNGLKRSHWRILRPIVNARKEDARFVAMSFINDQKDWEMPEFVKVQITNRYCKKPYDYDGLACLMAPTVDGLVIGGLFKDDSPLVIVDYRLKHEKVTKEVDTEVIIEVWPVSSKTDGNING